MNYAIWIVSPPNYNHSQCFEEIAQSLQAAFIELGRGCEITTEFPAGKEGVVILGGHLAHPDDMRHLVKPVVWQLEQMPSEGEIARTDTSVAAAYRKTLSMAEVWDYSEANIAALKKMGIEAKLLEVGYSKCLTRIENVPEPDIDVLFIGSMNQRRAHVLQGLQAAGVKVVHAFDCYGVKRDALIARAKVVLNAHYHEAKIWEIVRCSYLLSNRKFIVSEYGLDKKLEEKYYDAVAFTEYDNLVDTCLKYLADEEGRNKIAQRGYEFFKSQSQTEFLKQVMNKPLLPTFDKLEPYIRRIDDTRLYTNFSPLNAEYQSRLGELFGAPCVTGSSATSLITATLMALDLPKGSLVAMPSWTFPATAAAVVSAGLVPYFVDVDGYGELSFQSLESIRDKIKAIVYVAPFGAPIGMGRIDLFAGASNIPVVIDAAAGFDSFSTIHKTTLFERQVVGQAAKANLLYPAIISTHATKVFGTGEGGFVTCHDNPLLEKIRRITNFGLTPERRIEYTGLNCKFSEYHAAVGLAELDGWPEKRLKLLEAVKPYGLDFAVTQIPVRGKGKMGVYGCHQHKAYADYPRTELPVTEDLIASVGAVQVGI